jgi:uroporphyrinogen-III synthase
VVYRSTIDGAGADELRERLMNDGADLVTFTSASSVNAFVAAVGEEAAKRAPAASIGPITTAAARSAGLEVVVEATESTIGGLVSAIISHVGGAA